MQSSHYANLEDLATLSSDDEKVLSTILAILNSQDDNQKKSLVEKLGNYPLRLLYAFSEKSPVVHSLLENDKYLNECWADRLHKMKYPFHPITSFDKSTQVSLFAQLKGVVLMKELDAFMETETDLSHSEIFPILNKACDLGIYKALVLRLNHYTNMIDKSSSQKKDTDAADTYIQFQFHDAHKLSNLYWATGCIDSSLILFNIVDYYFTLPAFSSDVNRFFSNATTLQFSWSNKYDDRNRPYPISILEMAVENIYIARLLSEFPQSKQITDEITHGRITGDLKMFSAILMN